jgi:CDP-diacylglycerol--glycerol-3-phosphate 3-phosphatidyltransferase
MLPVLLLVRMALNAVDGMLAREYNMKSRLGALLNELGDVASDAGLYLPLGFVLGTYALVPVLITVVLLALGEMAGILGQVLTDTRHYQGPMGKSDRAVAFGGLALVHGLFGLAPMVIGTVLWLIVALSCMTVFNRCRASLAAPARGASEQ